MMADKYEIIQSIIFGLIFSYLLAKLCSIIFAFRDDNLRIIRASDLDHPLDDDDYDDDSDDDSHSPLLHPTDDVVHLAAAAAAAEEEESRRDDSVVGTAAANRGSSSVNVDNYQDQDHLLADSDSDWEGVESTELDETFSAATTFVAATAADKSSHKASNDVQLQLYALYKIATEGPCTSPQPSALKMTARAKWQAWQKLGAMPPEEAMEKYIDIVTDLYPSWADGASSKKQRSEIGGSQSFESKGPMGPVFSTFTYEDEPENELKLDAMHAFAREGDEENMRKCIESGSPVNVKDSEGRTPLHWAVDRGHLNITQLLLSRNSDVNAKDNEGQTPLHYAAVCGRAEIAEYLVNNNAGLDIKDNDGASPADVCELDWPWMHHAPSS